jgi:hypothetical protein
MSLFFGRQPEVQRLIESILTPGQHGVLFGDRGVGKSSLANVASELLFKDLLGGTYIHIRCDSQTRFHSIGQTLADHLGFNNDGYSRTTSNQYGGDGGVSLPGIKAGLTTAHTSSTTWSREGSQWTPRTLAAAVGDSEGLLVIDEFDALVNPADRQMVAEVIKHLSDADAALKLLVVGIATSCSDLMAGHPSVQRCVREVALGRMTDGEIREIIEGNAGKLQLSFPNAVVDEIVRLSTGYPHFAHLLGLKCAEEAIGEGRTKIREDDLPRAIHAAVNDAEQSLRTAYANATRSYSTDMYAQIVAAAADLDGVEFNAAALRAQVSARAGRTIDQQALNNYFQRLVGEDDQHILRREAKGVYRFTDPRMKSFVRIMSGSGVGLGSPA